VQQNQKDATMEVVAVQEKKTRSLVKALCSKKVGTFMVVKSDDLNDLNKSVDYQYLVPLNEVSASVVIHDSFALVSLE